MDGVFEEYVKTIFDKKLKSEMENNDIQRLVYKLLLNSLYGRLGIKGDNLKLEIYSNKPNTVIQNKLRIKSSMNRTYISYFEDSDFTIKLYS